MRISDWSSDVCSSDLKALDSPPCSSHPQKLQAHEPLHAVLAHEHTLQCTAAEPGQSAAASMPSQWTSELPSMRTTSPANGTADAEWRSESCIAHIHTN